MNILAEFKHIKAFVLDVDGVLTDGSLFLPDDGEWVRRMHIRDGYALQLAVKKGYYVLVISGSHSTPVKMRLEKLGITDVFMNVLDKKKIMDQFISTNKLETKNVLFMGDDIPDLEAMLASGLPCCPADAAHEIKEVSHYISPVHGGSGCVRDVIEKVLKLNGDWQHHEAITSK